MRGPVFAVQHDGAHPWPFIITADDAPAARVTDQDTAETTAALAHQISREGWAPYQSVRRALQDHQDAAAEGRADAPGWIDWSDWTDQTTGENRA